LRVWPVEVEPIAVTEWLIDTGFLAAWDADNDDDAAAITALSQAIATYSRR